MDTKLLTLMLMVFCSGCNWYFLRYDEGPLYNKYKWGCLEVDSPIPLNQAILNYDFEEVRDHFDKAGLIKKADFCKEFGNIPIAVNPNVRLGDGDNTGQYSVFKGIEVNHAMYSMGHELIHAYQANRGMVMTASHMYWDQLGYTALAEKCSDKSNNPDIRKNQPDNGVAGYPFNH